MHKDCGTKSDWIMPDNQDDDAPNQSLYCYRCVYKSGECAAGDQCSLKEAKIRLGSLQCTSCGKHAHNECIVDMQCLKCDLEEDKQKLAACQILDHDEIMIDYAREDELADDQTGIGTDGFLKAHDEYKRKDSSLKSLKKQIKTLENKKPGASGRDSTSLNNELRGLRAELAKEEGYGGEAAMNAILHQKDSIEALLYSTESDNDNMDDYSDDAGRRFFARLTEAACQKIGKTYPRVVRLSYNWVLKTFQPDVIATVQASRAGILPLASSVAPVMLKSKDDNNSIKWQILLYEWRPVNKLRNKHGEQDGHILVERLQDGKQWQPKQIITYKSLFKARNILGRGCVAWILNNVDAITRTVRPNLDGDYGMYTERTDRQVCALRCQISQTTAAGSNKGGKIMQTTQKWKGLIAKGSNPDDKYIDDLETDWVNENFDHDYLQQCIKQANLKTNFVKIPPGAPRSDVPPFMSRLAPELKYVQGADERLCMVLSLASALHILGLTRVADVVQRARSRLENVVYQPQKIVKLMAKNAGGWVPTKLTQAHDIFDEKEKVPYPKMIVLRADDGGAEHAVTICGNLVFDSTCPHALPLNQETLNWCCRGTYIGVLEGYCFKEHPDKKRPFVKKQLQDCTI
jgi:hypothetical protein